MVSDCGIWGELLILDFVAVCASGLGCLAIAFGLLVC